MRLIYFKLPEGETPDLEAYGALSNAPSVEEQNVRMGIDHFGDRMRGVGVEHLDAPTVRESIHAQPEIHEPTSRTPEVVVTSPFRQEEVVHIPDRFVFKQGETSITDHEFKEGAVKSAIGYGTTGGAYATNIVAGGTLLGGALSGAPLATLATPAGILVGAPLAGAGIGYAIGKQYGSEKFGTLVGAGVTSTAAAGYVGGVLSTIPAAIASAGWAVSGAVTYGMGLLHNVAWKGWNGFDGVGEPKKKPGIFGTFVRGVIAPGSAPLGYFLNRKGRAEAKRMEDLQRREIRTQQTPMPRGREYEQPMMAA